MRELRDNSTVAHLRNDVVAFFVRQKAFQKKDAGRPWNVDHFTPPFLLQAETLGWDAQFIWEIKILSVFSPPEALHNQRSAQMFLLLR